MVNISVVIPTYNRASLLKRAIDSVLSQSFKNFELIIVDDGSEDDTQAIVEEFRIQDTRVQYYKIPNGGVSKARNFGIEKAKGKWIALLDSDDEWLSHKLETQINFAKENPDCPLIHGEEIWIRRGKRVNPKKKHQKFGGRIFEKCLPLCVISPSASFIKKELLSEFGGFDESFPVCEDYDLWLKITAKYPVGFIEDPIIIKYGGHSDQLSQKYFAMDYWRVRALEQILNIEDFSSEITLLITEEMVKKSQILKQGYEKHQNFRDYEYIEGIIQKYSSKLPK